MWNCRRSVFLERDTNTKIQHKDRHYNTKIQDKHKHIDTTQTHRYNTKTKTDTKIQDIHFLIIAFYQLGPNLGAILKMPFFTVQKGDGHTDHWSGQPQT